MTKLTMLQAKPIDKVCAAGTGCSQAFVYACVSAIGNRLELAHSLSQLYLNNLITAVQMR